MTMQQQMNDEKATTTIPPHFVCPLTCEIMQEPIRHKLTGYTYEKEALFEWMDYGESTCPMSGKPLKNADLEDNVSLKKEIDIWRIVSHCIDPQILEDEDMANNIDKLMSSRYRALAKKRLSSNGDRKRMGSQGPHSSVVPQAA